jgi:predicted nucleic acid-binding protein
MIADTSAWIELLRASGSPAHLRLQRALDDDEACWVPEVIYREVLQGARSVQHFVEMQKLLDSLPPYISTDPLQLARSASLLYARCRWQGLRLQNSNDCLVVACAIEAGEAVLARDSDFMEIARIEPQLKLIL